MSTTPACQTCGAALAPDASTSGLCPSCLFAQVLAEPGDPDAPDETPFAGLAPGSAVGRFRLDGLLGTGGMSTVYRAYEPELDRVVALKVLPAEFLHDETFAQRFRQEARVVAALEHPHIVPVYATGIDDGLPWMSMRMLAGHLGTLVAHGPIDIGLALGVLRAVASALDHAHLHGVVHRDVKPSNILLDEAGHVCVGDFGLAHVMERSLVHTRTGVTAGTPHYMAPEQALGIDVDARTDVYGLGVVAYEMLTGRPPYDAPSPVAVLMKHVNDPLPDPPRERVPAALLPVLQRALAKEVEDRWPTATAFVDAMEQGASRRRHLAGGGVTDADTARVSGLLAAGTLARGWAQKAARTATTRSGLLVVAVVVTLGIWSQSGRQPEQPAAPSGQDVAIASTRPPDVAEPAGEAVPATQTPASATSSSTPDDAAGEVEQFPPVTGAPDPPETATTARPGIQTAGAEARVTPPPAPVPVESDPPASPGPAPNEPREAAPQEAPRGGDARLGASAPAAGAPATSEGVVPLATGNVTADFVDAPSPTPVPDPAPIEPVVEPVLLRPVPMPDYPVNARRFGLEGTVRLEATIGVDGRVSAATVVGPVHPLLDDAAREVVLRYEYEPGRRNGQPDAFRMPVTVEFKLDD